MKRVDTTVAEEIPSLPIYIARKLMPAGTRFTQGLLSANPSSRELHQEASSAFLVPKARKNYLRRLLFFLTRTNVQLQGTPKDGYCLLHSLAILLNVEVCSIQQQLFDALFDASNFDLIPAELASEMLDSLEGKLWGDPAFLALAARVFNKKLFLISANPHSGELQFQLFTPDGNGSLSTTYPANLDIQDVLVIVHNGQGHYLAGLTSSQDDPASLASQNLSLLGDVHPPHSLTDSSPTLCQLKTPGILEEKASQFPPSQTGTSVRDILVLWVLSNALKDISLQSLPTQ